MQVLEKRARLSGRRGCTGHTCTRVTTGKCHGQGGRTVRPSNARALNLSQSKNPVPRKLLRQRSTGIPDLVLVQRQVTDTTSRTRIWKMGSIKNWVSSCLEDWSVLDFDSFVNGFGFLSHRVRTAFSGGKLLRQNASLVPLVRSPFGVFMP